MKLRVYIGVVMAVSGLGHAWLWLCFHGINMFFYGFYDVEYRLSWFLYQTPGTHWCGHPMRAVTGEGMRYFTYSRMMRTCFLRFVWSGT